MKLIPAPNDNLNMILHRLVSENELVEMGVYKVIYGWRVRAGFVGEPTVNLDWCAGGNWSDVERLYSLCSAVLSNREENRKCFDGLPSHSLVKPFYLDLDFVKKISDEAGDFKLLSLVPKKF